jgi:diguanylate cyclase (GGDEF)-like protein/PAS domain S-box-containing protein
LNVRPARPVPVGTPPESAQAEAQAVAEAWTAAIIGTSFVSMSLEDLRAYLRGLAGRLIDAMRSAEFDPSVPHTVGESLVAIHLTRPESLRRTLETLEVQLPGARLRSPGDRLGRTLTQLACGYATALRERTLSEQEGIIAAAMSARQESDRARWASEARFTALFADAAIGISISTVEGVVLEVNRAMCDMFGYSREEMAGRSATDFVHPERVAELRERLAHLAAGALEHYRMEAPFYRRDSTVIWTDVVVSLIRDEAGAPRYAVSMIEDITERYLLQTRLRYQALHDPLTELPNRTLFYERLGEVLADPAPGARVGLCYLDVDGFKAVNDSLGHDVGDQLLRAVAGRLAQRVAHEGHLVARMGGDEFVVLVPDSGGTDQLAAIAEAAIAAVRGPVRLGGHSISVSASVGVVERPAATTTAAELMKAADTTLYWAKADGRDRWALFDAARHAVDVARYGLSAALPAALERGEFFVEYQPLVRLGDRTLAGVEALVRWRHPERGVLGPDAFVGLAEETGMVVPLGAWVLAEACHQATRWRARFPDREVLMSVNLAPRQLSDPGLVGAVREVLAGSGLPPRLLQLELTEHALMGTGEGPLRTLQELAGLGVRVAIDDFGTGYSNLAYLRNLPVGALKLAGSFVAPTGTDPIDREIVGAVVQLSHALGLSVTAEEVETAEQAAALLGLGCDLAQGYLYARAVPGAEIEAMLAPGRPGLG